MSRSRSLWRSAARRLLTMPGVRLLAPGWPDAGRLIVQLPILEPLVARAARESAPRQMLNAGVGEGLHTPLLRRHAPAARLFEFDYGSPQPANAPHVHRFCASLDAIAVASSSVDLVLCTEVLEHVLDDTAAVAELRRVMTPGGRLVLSVPTPPAVPDSAHVREGYTLAQLTTLLAAHDLEVMEARYCMHRLFQTVLRHWRPRRVPLGVILALAWLDRLVKPGAPMDLAVLARRRSDA